MAQSSRDNHFVPKFYLRRWAEDHAHVLGYRTLVSHAEVPLWISRSIKGVAFHRDLYTVTDSDDLDAFERWLASEFETPALEAIERATMDRPLKADDHLRLAEFFAAQDVRTPASYLESRERWETQIPETFKSTVQAAARKLEDRVASGKAVDANEGSGTPFDNVLRISVSAEAGGEAAVHLRVSAGRAFWLAQMRSLLTGRAIAALRAHKWSVVTPSGNAEWITSDHPTMRLNFASSTAYDFGGGWGRKNCDLILPLSPRHLLYAQVGTRHPEQFQFRPDQTRLIQRLLAERAHRWVFAQSPTGMVSQDRPRVIDPGRFEAEHEFWTQWDRLNRDAETD